MDVYQALAFVERLLVHDPLTDTERDIFIGTWQGKTYREIQHLNPEYVEKSAAPALWKRLSEVLGERVLKSRLKGAVERAIQRMNLKRVFISYRGQEPDQTLANQLYDTLSAQGHLVFASNLEAIASLPPQHSPVELAQTDQVRRTCDCFILLISAPVAVSEVAIEELKQLRHWRSDDQRPLPQLIAIVIHAPQAPMLSHDLRHYLYGAILWQWHSTAYTPKILNAMQKLLAQGGVPLPSQAAQMTEAFLLAAPEGEAETVSLGDRSLDNSPNNLLNVSLNTSGHDSGNDADLSPGDNPEESSTGPPSGFYPLPMAEPEVPKGLVRLASTFYVERSPWDAQCYAAISQPGALIRIKAPRQMGKTSLMSRILEQAREQGYRAIPLSFQHADRATFENLGTLLRWFCMKVAHKLKIPHRLDEYWMDTFGSKDNCTYYFEEYVLPETPVPLVLGLDEVDCVFQYPAIADDFFGLLRAWYEEASYGSDDSELWEKLRLVVVHSTEVYIPLDVNQSPFNVGLPIELNDFTPAHVMDLAHRHNLDWTDKEVKTLMTLVGGHPYLIRLALYYIAKQQTTLAELCHTAPTDVGIYDDHLRRHLWHLTQNPDLAAAYHSVLSATHPIALDSEPAFKLHSLGLVHFKENGVIPSFDLYRQYFSDRLRSSASDSLPSVPASPSSAPAPPSSPSEP